MRSTLVVMLLAAVAHAEVKAPPGWRLDEEASMRSAIAVEQQYRAQGREVNVVVGGYEATDGPGALYVTILSEPLTGVDEARRNALASEKLADLPAAATRGGGVVDATSQQPTDGGRVLEGSIRWHNAEGVRTIARGLVAATSSQLASVTGECFLGADSKPATEKACTDALAALTVEVPAAERVALAIVPVGAAAPAAPSTPEPAPSAPGAGMSDAPRLDSSTGSFAPMSIAPAERPRDRRPVYVGLGIIVLAIVFWWNRRQRDRFDREDRGEAGKPTRRRDEDSDDLHDAARGDKDEA